LKDLKINPQAFNDFHEGLRVVEGSVGKLNISLTLTSLFSKPIIVTLEDLFLICSPHTISV
jgi:hypothetical protein